MARGLPVFYDMRSRGRDREAEYRDRQWKTFQHYGTEPTDWEFTGAISETRDANGKPNGVCELCGHHPIAYKFYLISDKSTVRGHAAFGRQLGVGSKCTVNFRGAHALADPRWTSEIADGKLEDWQKHKSDVAYEKAERAVKQAQKKLAQANKMVKELGLSYDDARFIADHWKIRVERIGKWCRIYVKVKRKGDWYALWTELGDETLKDILEAAQVMRAREAEA